MSSTYDERDLNLLNMRNDNVAPSLDPKSTLKVDRKDIVPQQPAERVESAVKDHICKLIAQQLQFFSQRLLPQRLALSNTIYLNHNKRLQTS